MRRLSLALVAVAVVAASFEIGRYSLHSQSDGKSGRRVIYYVDPMHPAYTSDRPGIAPDCGMKLVPVFSGDSAGAAPSAPVAQLPPGAVRIDPTTQQLFGIRVAPVERRGASRTIRAVGRVSPEDSRVYRINSGMEGFIRGTYDDSMGTFVKKDQKLAAYYSPDFLAAASGFLAATERIPGAIGKDGARFTPNFPGTIAKEGVRSIQGYTDHLRNLGASDGQIKRIAESRELPDSIDIVSPADGFVLSRNITPGQHFDHGMEFYRVADLSRVWVIAEVYERDVPSMRPGGMGKVISRDAGRHWSARVTESLPQSDSGGGTVKVRLEIDNPGFLLRPDMLVDVEFPAHLPAAVTVPVDALVDSGTRTSVYVEHGEGVFEPREVETGRRSDDQVEILHGVQPGERVVVAAAFLVDSESRLRAPEPRTPPTRITDGPAARPNSMATAKIVRDPVCGMVVDPSVAAASGNSLEDHGKKFYFCSPEHKRAFQKDPSASSGGHQGDD